MYATAPLEQYVTTIKSQLHKFISENAFKTGTFTLASGAQSSYYFDGKTVLFDQHSIKLFSHWIINQIYGINIGKIARDTPLAIGGQEIGAIPIACTVSALAQFDVIPYVIRKTNKDHGTNKLIEGHVSTGTLAVIVEDVVTTGASLRATVDALLAVGAIPVMICCLVDRTNVLSRESAFNHPEFGAIPFVSLFQESDFTTPSPV